MYKCEYDNDALATLSTYVDAHEHIYLDSVCGARSSSYHVLVLVMMHMNILIILLLII